tara:strand:+ start:474 stop:641 length:168 start_codon:yes stop_codon:yes gene_type:complete
MEYELYDYETPSLTLTKLEEKIRRKKEKEENPDIKPKDVFVGYIETKLRKRKTKK